MAEPSPAPKLTGELALMAELDTHLSPMGPKKRAEAADCVYAAVDVALRERLDPNVVRRAVGWHRDRAHEIAKEAQAEYDRRKAEKDNEKTPTPPEPEPFVGDGGSPGVEPGEPPGPLAEQ